MLDSNHSVLYTCTMTTMPYNTRRKSLSLPSLGIQLPAHSRAHRSNSKPSSPDLSPPAKRLKRSHDDTPLSPSASPKQSPQRRVTEHTPPPSPSDNVRKIDTDGINDDIVVAVIEQLEKTGNRPHLIKELSTVLASTNENIAQYVSTAVWHDLANNPTVQPMQLHSYRHD